ncbi:MAG: heme lyase CcmF/NrfE family subunit [Gammaproteobacteria bacterium]|nr:heme lyase CcmF/NrfE family subunit [Gammaproteobacteria bacterium]
MIPEIGHFALIMAFTMALVQFLVPITGAWRGNVRWMQVAIPAARLQFAFLIISLLALTYSFIKFDFSIMYVASNSNSLLPWYYRISAVWGAHEGSLLLWAAIMGGWTFAVSHFTRTLPLSFSARVLGALGFASTGFIAFTLFTSNPFERLIPMPLDGNDLNPQLQDIGLIIHPPMLYMGYVGMVVPFAFAIAALLEGKIDAAWIRWTRPWTTVAWVFLTAGIALGSWWAYYELGWGGWWFWDPVENASFMPWLIATALIHSLAVTEQRGAFKAWTILLSIFAFSFSLLGTFLVRSGVLVSVHAFATDPERGVFILAFLAVVIGGALILFAWRSTAVSSGGQFSLFSKELLLLLNNVLLVVVCGTVFFGTLYPLFVDALGMGKISVGVPYFNAVFVPLMLPLAFLLGFGPMARWGKDDPLVLAARLRISAVLSILLGVAMVYILTHELRFMIVLATIIALWVMFSTLQNIALRISRQDIWGSLRKLPRGFVGMCLAHFGVGVFIIGAMAATTYKVEEDVKMYPGDTYLLAGYLFRFDGMDQREGPNYSVDYATMTIFKNNKQVMVLHPEKRHYPVQDKHMTEAGIGAGFFRDLYVSLADPVGNGGAWAMRLHFKPFQRWTWYGPLLMVLGGILAASDRRYRVRPTEKKDLAANDNKIATGDA